MTRTDQLALWDAAAVADFETFCAREHCVTARRESLARHTSMGVGGPTPLMFWATHPEAVATTLAWCVERGLGWKVIGGGTNVLVSDDGVTDPVLNLSRLTDGARLNDPAALIPAGMPTARALRLTIRQGLDGLVWATGLPGTIGGAVAGNAGCWGGQMADVVTAVQVVDADAAWRSIAAAELTWGYRRLNLTDVAGAAAVIVSANVQLQRADADRLSRRSDDLHDRKRERQPVGARNAGCIFKNPDGEHSAGKLIDRAGCKGRRVGDAQISELHGNFLINRGDATARQVTELIESVKESVRRCLDVTLEEEIHLW